MRLPAGSKVTPVAREACRPQWETCEAAVTAASPCHTARGMVLQRSKLRAGALIAASALALHELRYLVGYGDRAGQAIAEQGHSYLSVAGALVAFALALAGVQLAAVLLGALRGSADERRPPFALVWALASAALLAVYAGQELTEGLLAAGHPAGLDALAGNGGLVAVPLAVGLGLLVALGLRGARAAIAAVAKRPRAAVPRPWRRVALVHAAPAPALAILSPIARNLAGRAPPAGS
jgi:hypothetical protein